MSCPKNIQKSLFRPLPTNILPAYIFFFLHLFKCSWKEKTVLSSDSGNESENTLLTVF